MIWVNIIASLILLFSLIGGLKEGAVKQLFYLIALLIAIPVAGISYHLLANLLSFIPGENWENFLGFFIMLALISVILYFVFLLPRRFAQKVWKKGLLFRLIGAALNIFNAAIGGIYPGTWRIPHFRMAGTGGDRFWHPHLAGCAPEFCSGNATGGVSTGIYNGIA